MSERTILDVRPIYGWGWVICGEPRFEVPLPFSMILQEAHEKYWRGTVLTEGHEFEGLSVALSQRHTEWTGHVNVEVQAREAGGKPSGGFATIERPAPQE